MDGVGIHTSRPAPAARIAAPDSAQERAADRIADTIARGDSVAAGAAIGTTGTGTIHRSCASCSAGGPPCADCAQEDDAALIHRAPDGNGASTGTRSLATSAVSGPGTPLPGPVRSYFEPRFGTDLGNVRLHTDAKAGRAARAIGAKAYTYGPHIAFAPGTYRPDTRDGTRLMAHELAHITIRAAQDGDAVQRDLLDDAQVSSLHPDDLIVLSTHDLEALLDDLRGLAAAHEVGSSEFDGLAINISAVEDMLMDRYSSESSPVESTQPATSPGLKPEAVAQSRPASHAAQSHEPPPETTRLPGIQPMASAPAEGRRVVRRVEIFVPETRGPGGFGSTRFFSNAHPIGENYMTQTEPDPTAGWNFDTYIDGPAGRIPAQHLGGTRYRVFMGSPECPGCHFGRGLEVDFYGQNLLEVMGPGLVSGISGAAAMRGSTAMTARPPVSTPRPPPRVTAPNAPGGGQVVPIRPAPAPAPAANAPPVLATNGSSALAARPAPQAMPAGAAQPVNVTMPNVTPANNNMYLPQAAPSLSPTTTSALTAYQMLTGQWADPMAQTAPGQGQQTGDRSTPCDYPLPIAWPSELPRIPWATLIRTRSSEVSRTEQGRMQREINAARSTAPPPQPCDEDVEHDAGRWNDPFDAHHMHPLFLGGTDTRTNLCSLNAAFHQDGHPRLQNQFEYLDVYMQCGINSGYLYQHPIGQEYYIDKVK